MFSGGQWIGGLDGSQFLFGGASAGLPVTQLPLSNAVTLITEQVSQEYSRILKTLSRSLGFSDGRR